MSQNRDDYMPEKLAKTMGFKSKLFMFDVNPSCSCIKMKKKFYGFNPTTSFFFIKMASVAEECDVFQSGVNLISKRRMRRGK